jgi:hypothetical protein
MPRIVIIEKIHAFKIRDKFYNIFIMKKYLKFLLVLLTIVFFNKHALSCDALNVKIGSGISQASEVFAFLEDHEEVYPEETNVVRYDLATFIYCPNSNLDKTNMQVFVYESTISGIKLSVDNPDEENKQIYNYTRDKYSIGNIELLKKGWTGIEVLKNDDDIVIYSKTKGAHGIIEELYISTKDFDQFTHDDGEIIIDGV